MSALSDALEASQAKAVAALGKAYVRRDETPDDELFTGLLKKIGLDDDFAIGFLLAAWSVLREQREQPPGEQAPKADKVEPATEKQWALIHRLCQEQNVSMPDTTLSKAGAHSVIDQLKAGTYKPEEWAVPF